MENPASKKIKLVYGLLLGLAILVVDIANYSFGDLYKIPTLVVLAIRFLFIGFVVIGIKKFKQQNNGFLSLGQAMKTGIGIAIIAGLIAAVYHFALTSYIEPDYLSKAADAQEIIMLEQKPDMSDQELEMVQEVTQMVSTPMVSSALLIASYLMGALIVSLVAGLVMKKEETPF